MLRHLSVHSSLKKSGIFFIIKESLNRKIIEKVTCNYTVCAICREKFLWENELQVCKCKKCWHRFHLFGEFHLEKTLNLGWDFQRSLKRLGGGFRENWVSDSLIVLWKCIIWRREDEKYITPSYSAPNCVKSQWVASTVQDFLKWAQVSWMSDKDRLAVNKVDQCFPSQNTFQATAFKNCSHSWQ